MLESTRQDHEAGSRGRIVDAVVEGQSRFTIFVKIDGRKTEAVVSALVWQMSKLPKLLKQSLIWDRGTELAAHKKFRSNPIWISISVPLEARGSEVPMKIQMDC